MSCMLAEGEDFAPVPTKLTISLEHKDAHGVWQQLHLTMLGLLQAQGPYIHEALVPEALTAREFRLRVLDWPIYYTVSLPDLASQNSYGPSVKDTGVFQNAVVIGDIRSDNATTAAQVLATHMAHHFALGFDLYLLYVRGADLTKAVQANSVTATYISEGKLHLVSLDALQIPMYQTGFRAWAAYDATKLIAYNHAALTLWGERFHIAVLDIDEMWSSKDASTTVNTWFSRCFPGSDIISASRVDMVCNNCLEHGMTELEYFQQHWNASDPTELLQLFSKVVGFSSDPKSIFDPDKVGQVWLHYPFGLSHSQSALVVVSDEAFDLAQDCVFVVHLRNLFEKRIQSADTTVDRRHWLVHRHRTNSKPHASSDTLAI